VEVLVLVQVVIMHRAEAQADLVVVDKVVLLVVLAVAVVALVGKGTMVEILAPA
jgi:hypothetical protein